MEYVIIGNGTAAIACIEGIRRVDKDGEIAVISSENHHCYGRPLISYKLLGKIGEEQMDYRPRDFYAKNGVKCYFGKTATAIDKDSKTVALDDGQKIKYEKLLYAAGSRPFVPPMEGLDGVKNKFTFMTFDDMKALESALSPEKRVLVIGAGLIGLKCVEGILHSVKSVTVVDLADRILPSILDGEGSQIVQKYLESLGVKFILNDSAASLKEGAATLKSGKKVPFDVLVVAVGVRANTELFKATGGECNRGVVVNLKCETSVKDIYAAGDCSEGYDKTIDAKRVLALLPNAYRQGLCAGINMAGGVDSYADAIPLNAIGFFGLHVLTAGVYEGELIADERGDNFTYKKLWVKGGKLAGFIFINDFLRAGVYTSLIKNGTPLDGVDINLLKEKPQLLMFSAEERAKKLARRV